MKIPMLIVSAASLAVLGAIAKADDHHYQALTFGGLTLDKGPFQPHGINGHVPDEAPGRGSPFTAFEEENLEYPRPPSHTPTTVRPCLTVRGQRRTRAFSDKTSRFNSPGGLEYLLGNGDELVEFGSSKS